MESHSDSIVAVSEPFEEEFEANASGSIEAEEVPANVDEDILCHLTSTSFSMSLRMNLRNQ